MADTPNIPSLSTKVDSETRRAFDAIRSWFKGVGKLASASDLTGTGIFSQSADGTLIPYLDMTVPPQVTGFTVTGAFSSIMLSWDAPRMRNFGLVEVYRATVDNLGLAVKIGTTVSTMYTDVPPNSSLSVTYYYWVRIVSASDIPGPYNAVAGTPGNTANDPAYVMELLLGMLGYDQFDVANGVFPLSTVTALPELPNVKYPAGVFVSLLADGKLYRNKAGVWSSEVSASDITGQIVAEQVADAAITTAKFAAGLEPVSIVSALPDPAEYTGPKAVMLTGNGKLYRYSGGLWTAAVPTSDLTGTVTDTQIAGMAASKVTGTMTDAQIAAVSATKVTGQIVGTQITDGAISTAKLAAGAVTAGTIAAEAITAAKIAAGTITAAQLAAGSITAGKIAAGTIQAADIAAGTITADKVAANTITAAQIAADTITAGQIAAGAISTSELAAGAITTAKLAAGAVTANELAANSITAGKIAAGVVDANAIAANSIVAGKIAAGAIVAGDGVINNLAIGTAQIIDGTMTNAKIGNLAVDSAKIADAAIVEAKIGTAAIVTAKIADAAITNAKIGDAQVDTLKIAGGAIWVTTYLDIVMGPIAINNSTWTDLAVTPALYYSSASAILFQSTAVMASASVVTVYQFVRSDGTVIGSFTSAYASGIWMSPGTTFYAPIPLPDGQTIKLQAKITSGGTSVNVSVTGRLLISAGKR